MASSAARIYEDFEPQVVFSEEDNHYGSAILYEVYLPDFSKEEIKVTVTSQSTLKAQGERHVRSGREDKWRRFYVERPIPQGSCDQDKISAMFKDGILTLRIPKLETPPPASSGAKPTDEEESKKNDAKSEMSDLKNDAKNEMGGLKNDAKSESSCEEEEEHNGARRNGVVLIAKQLEMKMRRCGKMVLNHYNNNNNNNFNTNLGLFLVLGASIGIALYVKNIYGPSA